MYMYVGGWSAIDTDYNKLPNTQVVEITLTQLPPQAQRGLLLLDHWSKPRVASIVQYRQVSSKKDYGH